jgi:cob(I)alamin adenosyltransferase
VAVPESGKIQIYTGDGKGKTTAGLGLALRARGRGKKVAIVFFDKGGDNYGERKLLKNIGVDWFAFGLDRIDPQTNRFRFGINEADLREAEKGLEKVRALYEADYDLLILDEFNTSIGTGLITLESALALVNTKPERLELVLTGRNAPTEIIERADLVTEMKLVKHYFYQGTPARLGIEF